MMAVSYTHLYDVTLPESNHRQEKKGWKPLALIIQESSRIDRSEEQYTDVLWMKGEQDKHAFATMVARTFRRN